MTNIDEVEQTQVVCPTCGKQLGTWGSKYFNHCGKRHDIPSNLAIDTEKNTLTEEDLEENETLVRCSKCGEFLLTTEETEFEHCGVKQTVADNLGDFGDLKEDDGLNEDEDKVNTTKTVLPAGKRAHTPSKDKKKQKASKTGEEEDKSDEGAEEDAGETETGKPDKEEETWCCIECDEVFSDNGFSDAVCPVCGCEYAEHFDLEE